MTESLFKEIVAAARESFLPEAREKNERLVINPLWTDSTVNANACRGCRVGEATINAYGGLARRPEVLPASFALVMAHELGHLYGGTPYIAPARQMSAEGQSDYFSTLEAFKRIQAKVPELQKDLVASEFVANACKDVNCIQALEGSLGLGRLLATLSRDPEPRFETPDTTVVSSTQLSYPETTQCRLDTYLAGWFNFSRPTCWFRN